VSQRQALVDGPESSADAAQVGATNERLSGAREARQERGFAPRSLLLSTDRI
jgi:hypothetical protein